MRLAAKHGRVSNARKSGSKICTLPRYMLRPSKVYGFDMLLLPSIISGYFAIQLMFQFEIDILGRAWNFVLFTRGMCAYIMGPMDRIRTHKNMQRKAELDQGLRDILGKLSREKLRNIPESRLNGIHALPVELWSQIIKHVLDLCFQPRRRQCRDVFRVLRLRFVCRTL
jgi:hypothetical protein